MSNRVGHGVTCSETLLDARDCASCVNSYDGADSVLRCRVHSNGLACSPAAAEGCKKFEREPGSDAQERDHSRAWCDGRGD